MAARDFIFSMAVYVFFYMAMCNIAVANFWKEFPNDRRRPKPGFFEEMGKSWFSSLLIWQPGFLPRESSATLRLQVTLCRWALLGMPVYAIYVAMVLL
jgi:hypothetical protein